MVESTGTFVRYTNGEFTVVNAAIPEVEAGKVLIKHAYSTINPVDGYLIHQKKFEGATLGAEGCGTIIKVGDGVS